jgi:molybdopterin biosynthesis enzyme
VRVRLSTQGGAPVAEPVLGGSSMVSTIVRADGLVVVPANVEGLGEGEEVEVLLYE